MELSNIIERKAIILEDKYRLVFKKNTPSISYLVAVGSFPFNTYNATEIEYETGLYVDLMSDIEKDNISILNLDEIAG